MQLYQLGIKRPAAWVLGLVTVGLVGTGTTVYWLLNHAAVKPDGANQTIVVGSQDLTLQIKANGVVQAIRKTNLSPREPGRIVQLLVDEGSRVKAGDVIARMDNDQVQA